MSSGSLPPERRSARLRLLPPTISDVISSEDTAHFPHHSRFLMAMPRDPGVATGVAVPPSMAASPSSTVRSVPFGFRRSTSPCRPCRALKASASKHDPKHTFSLRARTLTCDSTSGMSGVSSATTPSGISSSPVTRAATSTVGRSYTLFCTSCRLGTTSTKPCASTGEMICHAPRSAACLRTGSNLLSRMDSGAAPPPRMTSSLKTLLTWPSTLRRSPIWSAMGWKRALYRSPVLCSAPLMRSITALARSAHESLPVPAANTCFHSLRHSTNSSLLPLLRHRLSSASATPSIKLRGPKEANADMDPSSRVRAVVSRARSR
mmetsp:Transcript_11917/g.20115  ORF Transcript_11917/g.20115 Transcript_11917/m.20115 type:complete len:320 (-) Transcript_11917:2439-3398(-)